MLDTSSILDGRFLDLEYIEKCCNKVRHKYDPQVLILSKDYFHQVLMAVALYGQKRSIFSELRKIGIRKIVWAEDVTGTDFYLASGKGLSSKIEALHVT